MNRFPLIVCATIVVLAGCGGSQLPIAAPGAITHSDASTGYKSLYSFGKGSDGKQPKAALIDVNGMLYGTTYGGGAYADGTVFSVSTTGTEKVLYSFHGGRDGANPSASLLAMKGALYGTTEYGGIPSPGGCNAGTVFRVNASGAEKVLYRFYGYNCHDQVYYDGANPVASLIDVKGELYGTTYIGGTDNGGTVFSISKNGNEKILHNFAAYYDGIYPAGALLYVKGNFYGTTTPGPGTSGFNTGFGTVFSMSAAGAETVLFTFFPAPYGSDGTVPEAALINVDGTLYSTTSRSGPSGGTVFSITSAGYLTSLYSFGSGEDGSAPYAPLLNVRGTLYGTTSAGGVYGKGTIFKLTLGGKEKVLHSFGYGSDGAAPLAGLINVKGTLYGTTSAGGKHGSAPLHGFATARPRRVRA